MGQFCVDVNMLIASLAFEQGNAAYLGLERLGILIGSLVSGLLGYIVLRMSSGNGVTTA